MKKIIVLSDTHNNQLTLRKVFENEQDYTHIIHLGDNYDDLKHNYDLTDNKEVFRVPGLYHAGYTDGSIPAILEVEIENWQFALAHNVEDLLKTKMPADIYLYGHTHHSNYDHIDDRHFINPGHLKSETDRGHRASYAVLKLDENNAELQFKHLDGNIFRHKSLKKCNKSDNRS